MDCNIYWLASLTWHYDPLNNLCMLVLAFVDFFTSTNVCLNAQSLKFLFPMYGRAMGYKSIAAPRPMHDTNQRASSIAQSVGHISQNPPSSSAKIPNSDDFQWESSPSYVATANTFMKFNHYAGALISTYTCEYQVGITMTKKVSIYLGIPPYIPLNNLGLGRLDEK